MASRPFDGYNCDLLALQEDVEIYFTGKGFRATNFHKGTTYITQLQKAELGSMRIFVRISGVPSRFEVTIGLGDAFTDIDDVPPVFDSISLPVKLLLADVGLESDFWTFMATHVPLHRLPEDTSTRASTPTPSLPHDREIVREIEVLYCRYCGAKNLARRATCLRCGGTLH